MFIHWSLDSLTMGFLFGVRSCVCACMWELIVYILMHHFVMLAVSVSRIAKIQSKYDDNDVDWWRWRWWSVVCALIGSRWSTSWSYWCSVHFYHKYPRRWECACANDQRKIRTFQSYSRQYKMETATQIWSCTGLTIYTTYTQTDWYRARRMCEYLRENKRTEERGRHTQQEKWSNTHFSMYLYLMNLAYSPMKMKMKKETIQPQTETNVHVNTQTKERRHMCEKSVAKRC